MGAAKLIRLEFWNEGQMFCFSEYPAPKNMTDEEARVWAQNQPGGKLESGWEWNLHVIESGKKEEA